ncbi:putative peptidase [subsurface metagenome]|nr:M24 family metallopeptidase [Hadesarchaea archaeon]
MNKRIRGLKKEINKRGLDVFLAIQNTRYLAGTTAAKAVIVPTDGNPILVCSRLEFDQAKREGWIRDVRAFSSWKAPLRRGERVSFCKPWQLVADCIQELGARAVGYDYARKEFIRKLRAAYMASYHELPELMLELRKIKSREEISLLRRSAKIATKGMRCAAESIAVSRTELEVAAEAEREMRMAGSEGTSFPTIVASGRNSWLPHASATRKRLRRGELVVVDLGAVYEGYASDMTRTFALSPTKKQLTLIWLVRRAQNAAINRVRNGAKTSDVDKAARRIISRAGYAKFSPHGTGHGVGMEVHELPGLSPDSKDILREGMVITVEPGIYVPRVGGARWEDMVLVTKNGCKSLTA